MKINIFGVGRSGTTALELYLAYWIARLNGQVWLNNEPYTWYGRKGVISYEGQMLFERTGYQFIEKDICTSHYDFLNHLVRDKNHVVTKFVKGSPLIETVNLYTQPDLSIILIREIFSVLKSLSSRNWDFFSILFQYSKKTNESNLDAFRRKVLDSEIFEQIPISEKEFLELDRFTMNGVYWYVVNKILLEYQGEKVLYLNFSDIQNIHLKMSKYLDIPNECKECLISNEMFFDKNLSKDFPLTDIKKGLDVKKYINPINEILFKLNKNLSLSIPLIHFQHGNYVVLSNNKLSFEPKKSSKTNDNSDFLHKELLEYLNKQILDLLSIKLGVEA